MEYSYRQEIHSHSHEEHRHHHHHEFKTLSKTFVICIILNALYVGIEATIGFFSNSVGLISDAGHNLSDVFSLILAFIAIKLSRIHPNSHYTYGYKKSTILVSIVNAVLLLLAMSYILYESITKINSLAPIDGNTISITAGIGIVVNGMTVCLLLKDQKRDLNVRGAFLHMIADTIVSVGVVISGLIISYTGLYFIDSIISIIISIIILISTWQLLKESIRLALDGLPRNVHLHDIRKIFAEHPHVISYHHLHIWPLSTTETAITIHIVIDDLSKMDDIKRDLKQTLRHNGIGHATIEIETKDSLCDFEADDCCQIRM